MEPKEPEDGNWSLYDRIEIPEPEEGETPERAPGWYYVLLTDFRFEAGLRWGTLGSAPGITDATLRALALKNSEEDEKTLYELSNSSGEEEPQLKIERHEGDDPDNPTDATITISRLWKYNLDGEEIDYWVEETGENPDKKIDGDELEEAGLDAGDYFAISYDNAAAPNYGGVTDRLHDGGSLYLTLSGTKEYKATKVWVDSGDAEKRPSGTFQLWRFRENESYTTAAPMRDDKSGAVITFELDTKPDGGTYEISSTLEGAGILGDLPKYDSEGFEYIYVLREYLDPTEGADSYEQVFGEIQEDGNVEDTLIGYPNGVQEREDGDINLYNGGTLTNRISGSVQVEATKRWEASAFQSELGDVTVEFTLQCRSAGEDWGSPDEGWKNYRDDEGKEVTQKLTGFLAETMNSQTASYTADKYDAWGKELEFRWIETAVYQGAGSEENLLNEDTNEFTLTQGEGGRKIVYTASASQAEREGDSYSNQVTNRISNTLDYSIEKQWWDAEGKPYIPEGQSATFVLYQIPSGDALDGTETPLLKITLDGIPEVEYQPVEGTDITFREDTPWHADIQNLPEFNENGQEYEYILVEENAFPTYIIERNEQTNDYEATVINRPGPGNRIMVRKQWIDDNDAQHRLPVQVEVYRKDTHERVGGPKLLGENGVWQDWVSINVDPEETEIYVLETAMGEDGEEVPVDFGEASPSNASAIGRVTTDHHIYEVTSSEAPVVLHGDQPKAWKHKPYGDEGMEGWGWRKKKADSGEDRGARKRKHYPLSGGHAGFL